MVFIPDKKLFLFLVLGFILFTVIGTLSHECGHYLVASFLGYSAEINYATTVTNNVIPGSQDSFFITLGGVLQTLLTGTFGVLLLVLYKKSFSKTSLRLKQWLIIFLSLFWLRQLFNLLLTAAKKLLNRTVSHKNDEMTLSNYLNMQELSISVLSSVLSLVVLWYVISAIPRLQRLTFLIALCLGSLVGFIIWMYWLGPLVMP